MSHHKSPNIIKFCLITSIATIVLIAISLIPLSRKASYWNQSLDKTMRWINEKEKDFNDQDKVAKESLAVAVCNGAVYEPKLQIKEFTLAKK